MPLTAIQPPTVGARRPARRLSAAEADVLRIVSDARTPVFVTVRADGRRRYHHWRPLDSATGRGGCYVALPTADCEALRADGRIVLGDPVSDPGRTTYRVSAAVAPSPAVRLTGVPAPARPARPRMRAA
ncbi:MULTISPECIES: hypothetical protein [unclassified Streptomyces]|uniref:hypothetical protein n=1 Tax=unclassified Streptomyces TaxID=2593676 RepID=UPI0037FC4791